jgi:hypothetical protein
VHRRSDPESIPLWFERVLVAATAAVLSFGAFGLLLAVIGDYRFAVVVPVGLALTAVLTWVAWPSSRHASGNRRSETWAALAMCLVALAVGAWNAQHAGRHVAIGRDPGIYAVTGKWIATRGNLVMTTGDEWYSKTSGVDVVFEGSYAQGTDHSQFQFDHLTPVLLAEGENLGGDSLMFRTPAVLAALGLLIVYGAGCRLLRRPWLVLAAVTALAVSMPELNAGRETLSEPAIQILLWSGLSLLVAAWETRRLGPALLGGAALAGTLMGRVDAPIYLIPLPLVAGVTWAALRSRDDRRFLERMSATVVVAAAPIAVLGLYDVERRAGHYYDDLHSDVHLLQRGFEVSALLGLLVVLVWSLLGSRIRPWFARAAAHRTGVATGAGAVVAIAILAAWLVRPHVMHPTTTPSTFVAALQRAAGLPVNPSRSYGEWSLRWISWYLGPAAVAFAALGAGLLIARWIRRPDAVTTLVLTVAGGGTALYLWKPNIFPDQIWAMRRFVPAALPLTVLLAACAIAVVADWAGRRIAVAGPVILVAGALALIIPPAVVTWPVRNFVPGPGDPNVDAVGVQATCLVTGPHAAILTAYNDFPTREIVGALRTWCRVPVAFMTRPFTSGQITHLASEWAAEGRTLWVIGSTPGTVASTAPGVAPSHIVTRVLPRELEVTLVHPPQHYLVVIASVYGGPAKR